MTVSLTISETLDGTQVADSLQGGGTGLDLGAVANNAFAPIVDKTLNTGRQDLYIRHDAVTDPITNYKLYIAQFGTVSGLTYGGQRSAVLDYAAIKTLGQNSGSSKNNADGLSGGLWVDFDADVSSTNQFDIATRPTLVKIFGDNGTDGIDLASAFTVKADAMVYDNSGETLASAAQDGKIGKNNDTALGDNAHLRLRIYLPNSYTEGGVYQVDFVHVYSFTA